MVIRYTKAGNPYGMPPYSRAEREALDRLCNGGTLIRLFGLAALRRRPKTKSRQHCRRQILAPSVSSPEPVDPTGPFANDPAHVRNILAHRQAVRGRELLIAIGHGQKVPWNLRASSLRYC